VSGQGHPPAGWYREPNDPTQERLWDGEEWRRWVRPYLEGRSEPHPAGWRVDPKRAGYEHLWTGEMWSGLTRPSDGSAPAGEPLLVAVVNRPSRVRGLGVWIAALLGLLSVGQVANIVLRQIYIARVGELIDGRLVSYDSLDNAVKSQSIVGTVYGGLELVAAVLFLVWFYRAYRNLTAFGIADLRFSHGWAVGGWFIPIFNFIRPKAVANDVWKGSERAAAGSLDGWREAPLAPLVNWWWGVWIAGVLIGLAAFRLHPAVTADDLLTATRSSLSDERIHLYITQASTLLTVAAAVLGALFVLRVSRMQEEAIAARTGSD
jgi:hypothetical protein